MAHEPPVPSDAIGLCASCRHARPVSTPRSQFWLCERSRSDSRYPRYPRLPVRECAGHQLAAPGSGPGEETAGG